MLSVALKPEQERRFKRHCTEPHSHMRREMYGDNDVLRTWGKPSLGSTKPWGECISHCTFVSSEKRTARHARSTTQQSSKRRTAAPQERPTAPRAALCMEMRLAPRRSWAYTPPAVAAPRYHLALPTAIRAARLGHPGQTCPAAGAAIGRRFDSVHRRKLIGYAAARLWVTRTTRGAEHAGRFGGNQGAPARACGACQVWRRGVRSLSSWTVALAPRPGQFPLASRPLRFAQLATTRRSRPRATQASSGRRACAGREASPPPRRHESPH